MHFLIIFIVDSLQWKIWISESFSGQGTCPQYGSSSNCVTLRGQNLEVGMAPGHKGVRALCNYDNMDDKYRLSKCFRNNDFLNSS